jgi:aspartate ammonia-lyase
MTQRHAEASLITSTALTPHIGYDRTDEIVKEAAASGKTWAEVAREKGVDEKVLAKALDLLKMAKGNLG